MMIMIKRLTKVFCRDNTISLQLPYRHAISPQLYRVCPVSLKLQLVQYPQAYSINYSFHVLVSKNDLSSLGGLMAELTCASISEMRLHIEFEFFGTILGVLSILNDLWGNPCWYGIRTQHALSNNKELIFNEPVFMALL